eukprot:EG_transcript_30041
MGHTHTQEPLHSTSRETLRTLNSIGPATHPSSVATSRSPAAQPNRQGGLGGASTGASRLPWKPALVERAMFAFSWLPADPPQCHRRWGRDEPKLDGELKPERRETLQRQSVNVHVLVCPKRTATGEWI